MLKRNPVYDFHGGFSVFLCINHSSVRGKFHPRDAGLRSFRRDANIIAAGDLLQRK